MSELFNLKDKNVLITGASSGIGRGVAQMLGEHGASLILTGRNEKELQITNDAVDGQTLLIRADLTEENDIDKLAKECPPLSGIVHAAGVVSPFPLSFVQKKHIHRIAGINLEAPILLNTALFRNKKIKKGAAFVFISSISSDFPYKGGGLYASYKSALETYSKTLALEHAPQGIRSNCIQAGLIKTPIFDETARSTSKEALEEHRQAYPLGFGKAEDVSASCLFLLSDASRWITGTNLVLDGGLTIGSH